MTKTVWPASTHMWKCLVYAADSKTGLGIYQRGYEFYVVTPCCASVPTLDPDGMYWVCEGCYKVLPPRPSKASFVKTNILPEYDDDPEWAETHIEMWVAPWIGVTARDLRITVEY